MNSYHVPALLDECLQGLVIKPEGMYADVTYGGGGHSKEIIKQLKKGKLIAFDKDPDALSNRIEDDRFVFVHHSFIYLKKFVKYYQMYPLDGVLADLGISSWQINKAERGFSTRFDESPLDMNMGQKGRTARTILETYSSEKLQNIFSKYGEIINSKTLANAIVEYRKGSVLATTGDLKKAIVHCVKRETENRYYAQLFQALRIEVNNEMEDLKNFLMQCADVIAPGGRLAVISYHSLEDRLVKTFMTKGNFEGEAERDVFGNVLGLPFRMIEKKPIVPSDEELLRNPRSRSAKLRIAERI